jgi:hypothetical protein
MYIHAQSDNASNPLEPCSVSFCYSLPFLFAHKHVGVFPFLLRLEEDLLESRSENLGPGRRQVLSYVVRAFFSFQEFGGGGFSGWLAGWLGLSVLILEGLPF